MEDCNPCGIVKEGKKALFLAFSLVTACDGVSKKIFAQRDALIKLGFDTRFVYASQMTGRTVTYNMDSEPFFDVHFYRFLQSNSRTFYDKLYDYINANQIQLLFVRYGLNATAALVSFFSKCKALGCKVVMEIATYPYDQEFTSVREKIAMLRERYYRVQLHRGLDRIVTYANLKSIYGTPTVTISNAVATIPPIVPKLEVKDRINLIAVANLAFWHGYDRLIEGMNLYYHSSPSKKVYCTIVGDGDGETLHDLKERVSRYDLEDYVSLVGAKDGKELDELFSESHLAIGSLGRHRSGIKSLKTLKNVEYAMRGIPFVYSEDNEDFDDKKYILKVPADDSPIDINHLCEFVGNIDLTPSQISDTASSFTWKNQLRAVIESVNL